MSKLAFMTKLDNDQRKSGSFDNTQSFREWYEDVSPDELFVNKTRKSVILRLGEDAYAVTIGPSARKGTVAETATNLMNNDKIVVSEFTPADGGDSWFMIYEPGVPGTGVKTEAKIGFAAPVEG